MIDTHTCMGMVRKLKFLSRSECQKYTHSGTETRKFGICKSCVTKSSIRTKEKNNLTGKNKELCLTREVKEGRGSLIGQADNLGDVQRSIRNLVFMLQLQNQEKINQQYIHYPQVR